MPKIKKILTVEQLVRFCEENKLYNFDASKDGYKLSVQIPAKYEVVEDNDVKGLMKLKVKVCHIGRNRNGSYISEENMKKSMSSLKYRPLLANIHKLDDGTYDFGSHDMEILTDDDGNEYINYIEKQIGTVKVKLGVWVRGQFNRCLCYIQLKTRSTKHP